MKCEAVVSVFWTANLDHSEVEFSMVLHHL
jgi:hypothetical protein